MRKSEQEATENNLIDSECHVAELEEALRDKQALLEASEKRTTALADENEYIRKRFKELDLFLAKTFWSCRLRLSNGEKPVMQKMH